MLSARYIVASSTATYNEPKSIFETPCDVIVLCAKPNELTEAGAEALAASGCKTVVDGGYRPVSSGAAKVCPPPGCELDSLIGDWILFALRWT